MVHRILRTAARVLLVAVVLAFVPPLIAPLFAHGGDGLVTLAMFGPLLGLKPKSYAALAASTKPNAQEPEFFPMTWFDSATFTSASTQGNVRFFQQTNADVTLSNMELAGQLPADEYFDIGEVHFDVLQRTTAETAGAADSAAVGLLDDLIQLCYTSRATITLTFRNKPYGPMPLALCRPLGFARANVAGAFAAATSVQFGGWDGIGLVFEKQLTLSPTSKLGIVINFPAQLTLSQASVVLRVSLRGVQYRPVA